MPTLLRSGGYAAVALLSGLLLIVQVGCEDERAPVDAKTMQAVVVDLHLAESRADTPAIDARLPLDSLLHQHQVSRAQFEAAQDYYSRNPSAYRDIYQEVVDSLRAIRSDVDDLRDAYEEHLDATGAGDPANISPPTE